MSYTYKTNGDVEFMIPGFGITVNGKITSEQLIENPNLTLIGSETETSQEHIEQPAPTHVAGVVAQSAQPVVSAPDTIAPVPQYDTPTNPEPVAPAPESITL